MGTKRAKVFWSGRSQAVRLPREFRLSVDEVEIHREGDRIILVPVVDAVDANGWPVGFWQSLPCDDDLDLGERGAAPERAHPLGDD